MNTATTLGLDAINKSRQAMVESEAKQIIDLILLKRKGIKVHQDTIKLEQESLEKLANDVILQRDVLGREYTGTLNVNQVTIAKVIAAMNDANTKKVELVSQSHLNRIDHARKQIASLEKEIAEWIGKMEKLEADVITLDQVVA